MTKTLKELCAEVGCLSYGMTVYAPAYQFALADGRGFGFVNGSAATGSPSKECHLVEGKVALYSHAIEVETDDGDVWLYTEGTDVPIVGIIEAIEAMKAALPTLGMSRDDAFDYLRFWFPGDRFAYP